MPKKSRHKFIRKVFFRSAVLLILFTLLAFSVDFILGIFSYKRQNRIDINYYYNVIGRDKTLALTFDDGPDPVKTKQVIEILDRHQVPATFFLMGSNVLRHPEIVEQIHSSGYEIGNHTFTHSPNVHNSQRRVQLELDVTNKLIANITGEAPVLYRPPFLLDIGSDPIPDPRTPSQPMEWASQLGYIPVGADIDSLDWKAESPEELIANVHSGLEYGHIVLLHDGGLGKYTVEALDELITSLKSQGYQFTTVSEIIGVNAVEEMTVTQDLAIGMSDSETRENVTALQTFLLKEGLYYEVIDGVFDPSTQESLIEWQIAENVRDEQGFVGLETRNKISESLQNSNFSKQTPLLIKQPDLERKLQLFYTHASSQTGKNIPTTMLIILGLVVLRILSIIVMFLLSWMKRNKVAVTPSRGVSIIIPVHNEAENIAATITSVILNKYPKFEIIVVDDGSTDASREIVKKIQKKCPELITLISISNVGKAQAMNVGIAKAKYNTLVTMDGDTIFHQHAIAKLVRNFANKDVAAVAGKVCVTTPRNTLSAFQHLEYVITQNIEKKAFGLINAVGVIPGPIGAWRKSAILEAGGYSNSTLVEDQDLTLALLSQGKTVMYEPEAIAFTESPHTLKDFIKQRLRWVNGTIQCVWKYLYYLGSIKRPILGWVLLPNIIIYTILLSLFYPLMDILLLIAVFATDWHNVLLIAIFFIAIDLAYSFFAAFQERHHKKLLFMLPFQRVFYRSVIWYVVIKSLVRAIEGTDTFWSKVAKRGDATAHQFLSFQKPSSETAATAK